MSRVASVDIGTNSALLLVAELENERIIPVRELSGITRLGEKFINSGDILPAAMERTLEVLENYQKIIQLYGAEKVFVFGTHVFRHARNAMEFSRRVKERLGWEIDILDEKMEAVLTFLGALDTVPDVQQSLWALDIGGGSTEVVCGSKERIECCQSFSLGGVQLKEKFGIQNRIVPELRSEIESYLRKELLQLTPRKGYDFILGIGGTLTSLAALDQKLLEYRFDRIDGYELTRDKIEYIYQYLNRLNLSDREKLPGMEKGRADIILPATLILLAVLERLKIDMLKVSARGVRYGVILWKAGILNLEDILNRSCA